jgi:hypothetical protein
MALAIVRLTKSEIHLQRCASRQRPDEIRASFNNGAIARTSAWGFARRKTAALEKLKRRRAGLA